MKLTDALRRAAQLRPDAIATIGPGRRKTFRQLESRVSCLASGLLGLGMANGDVVAIAAGHSDRTLEMHYAIAWSGGIAVPVDPRLAFDGLCELINDSQATILVLDDHHANQTDALIDHCPFVRALVFCGEGPCPEMARAHDALIVAADPMADRGIGGEAIAALCYRRTDDGQWLGSQLSHQALCFASLALAAEGSFSDAGTGLQAITAVGAENLVFSGSLLLRGSAQAFLAPETGLGAAIAELGITDLMLPAAALQGLLAERPQEATLAGLGQILIHRSQLDLQFGASLSGVRPALEARYPAAALRVAWGTPELCGIATVQPLPLAGSAIAVGRPIAYLELRIAGDDGREASRGAFGTLYARGPTLFAGYWNRAGLTALIRQQDWVHGGVRAVVIGDGGLMVDPVPLPLAA